MVNFDLYKKIMYWIDNIGEDKIYKKKYNYY